LCEGLSISTRNGTSWSGHCEVSIEEEVTEMGNYAGVDWASEKHDVVVQDEAGEELLAASFAHDEQGAAVVVPHARAHESDAGGDRAA
jgi:hypothetical protein